MNKKIENLLSIFKRANTVSEWNDLACEAMLKQSFVIESLDVLRTLEAKEANRTQQQTHQFQQGRGNRGNYNNNYNQGYNQNNRYPPSSQMQPMMNAQKAQEPLNALFDMYMTNNKKY